MGWEYVWRSVIVSVPLLASDLSALAVSLWVPWTFLQSTVSDLSVAMPTLFALLASSLILAMAALRLYPGFGVHGVVELERLVIASVIVFGAFILSEFLNDPSWGLKGFLLAAGAVYVVSAPIFRVLTRKAMHRAEWWRQPLLVFGPDSAARRVSDYFSKNPGLGFSPIRVEWRNGGNGTGVSYEQVARDPRVVSRLARGHGATCAAVPLSPTDAPEQDFFLEQCANVFPQLLIVPEPRSLPDFWTCSADVGGGVGVRVGRSLLNPVSRGIKRVLDWALTIPIVVLTLPLFGLVALVVRLTSPGPIFYSSERIGRGRRRFQAWKFRTMYVDADSEFVRKLKADPQLRKEWAKTNKLRSDPRVTPVGRWLRKASLDELPQLWNVLRGDMSLVGPRPVLPEEVGRRGRDFGLYLSVQPGLTGLWQISGRSNTTYDERRRLDSYYVRNWSLWLDIYILVGTIRAVVSGHGAH
ncbi:MAG: undecaprenyl-phosphate galactose phosphotransferase WbaP [Gemmatimonadetes bacterium]|nr:undecaprenyl-phosphate galactose phosphotransferase WbaP [Gemmatimonadota bacterium]